MKFLFRALIMLACMAVLPLAASAQETATQTVDLGNGYSIVVPANFQARQVQDGMFAFTSDSLSLTVMTPTRLHALSINFANNTNIADALADLVFPLAGVQIDRSAATKLRADNRQAAAYTETLSGVPDQEYIAITLSDGEIGYLVFSAATGQLPAKQSLIDTVTASFDSSGTLVNTGSGSCTVSADTANSAQLRVGPGPNRGAISFLPANTPVTVTGRIELADGSIWYQLDKTEAAPKGTAAAELWVAAQSITASGDCATVGDTSAPPIIQAVVPPPAASNNGAPGDTSSAPGSGGGPGALPTVGRWTLTYNATTNASCVGYENVAIPTSELLDKITYTYTLTAINEGAFKLGGDVFTRATGTNTFTGLFTFDDGTSVQAWLTVNAPTSISGQVILNFTEDGTQCSSTLLFAASKG
jgi:hypothetical protein